MADISALGSLATAEPLDLDMYPEVKGGPSLPAAGRYTVRAPESFPAQAFGATKAGFLSAQVDPTIVGPTNEGYTIRYTKVSAKTFKRSGQTASQMGDYLKATGRTGQLPADPQGLANAVEQTAGAIFQVDLDWRAYNKNTGFSIEGMRNFPKDAKGEPQAWIEDPSDKDEHGNPVRLRANVVVTRYLSA